MSAAEAEIAKLAESFNMNLTTDFGQIEEVIQEKIDQNRGKVRVAADLSSKGIAEIDAEERMQAMLAEEALTELRSRARSEVAGDDADCVEPRRTSGPAATDKAVEKQTN